MSDVSTSATTTTAPAAGGEENKDTRGEPQLQANYHLTPAGKVLWPVFAVAVNFWLLYVTFLAYCWWTLHHWVPGKGIREAMGRKIVSVAARILGVREPRGPGKPLHPSAHGKITTIDFPVGLHTDLLTVGDYRSPQLKVLFYMIPGNPGNVEFYREYAEHVWELSGCSSELAVVVVGYLGHSQTLRGLQFSLQEQISHKKSVLKHLMDNRDIQVVLGGHSVGAHVCAELLRDVEINRQVRKSLMLFPTVHHIGSTPNGHMYYPLLAHMRTVGRRIGHLLYILPARLQDLLIRIFVGDDVDPHIPGIQSLFHEDVVGNAMAMAHHEMHEIEDLDHDHFVANADKLHFYFAEVDHWLSDRHEELLKSVCADSTFVNCEKGIRHAFVLRSGKPVAQSSWEVLRGLL